MDALLARREAFLEETGTIAPSDERHELFNLKQRAESELADVEQKLRVNQQNLAQARLYAEGQAQPDPSFFISLGLGNFVSLNALKQKRIELEMERETLSPRQTPDHPELSGVIKGLKEVEDQIRQEARASLKLLESEENSLRERERSLESLVAHYREELEQIPRRETALGQLDHEMATLRDRYKELVEKEIQARISDATSPIWTVTILSKAGRPMALRTTDYVRLALAPILSLVVGLMLAFFLDSLDHSLKTATDVEEFLGVPVLATLPEAKG
jgi:uncharacterized protein involved in exopolysaccharide biosynthesis